MFAAADVFKGDFEGGVLLPLEVAGGVFLAAVSFADVEREIARVSTTPLPFSHSSLWGCGGG